MKILLDTMYILKILKNEEMREIARLIDQRKIAALTSTINLIETYTILAKRDKTKAMKDITRLRASELKVYDVTSSLIETSGDFRNRYNLPLADSIIAATGVTKRATHILTNDAHFNEVKKLIKPIDLKAFEDMLRREGQI